MSLSADEIGAIIDRHAAKLRKALKTGGDFYSLDDVKQMVIDGQAYLFPGRESVVIATQVPTPKGDVLDYWLVAGNIDEVLGMERAITAWARNNGAIAVRGHGRPGWGPFIEESGYKQLTRTWVKDLR